VFNDLLAANKLKSYLFADDITLPLSHNRMRPRGSNLKWKFKNTKADNAHKLRGTRFLNGGL